MKIVDSFIFEDVQGYKFGYAPFGKPKSRSYIYFIDGLLIDTGPSVMRNEVFEQVKDLAVEQIFITHFHEDHSGNIDLLRNHFNCPVYASGLCCEIMKSPPKISLSQKIYWGDRPAVVDIIPIANHISTSQFEFNLIPIPGHALDMIALYEHEKRWLFSADLYVNWYIAYFLKEESTIDQINSIKTILELDFDTIFCSHNPQLSGGKEKLARKLGFLQSFYDDVAKLYKEGLNAQQIFKQLAFKENWVVRLISGGDLSKLNMVKSVIRDVLEE